MTVEEAIKTTKIFIADLEASDIPIYADEREALETLISFAKAKEEDSVIKFVVKNIADIPTQQESPNARGGKMSIDKKKYI